MRQKLFLVLLLFLTTSLSAQWSISINGGAIYLPSDGIYFKPYGQTLGIYPSSGEALSAQFGVSAERCIAKFRLGFGLNFMPKNYDVIVHRYAIYYSPGGNPYGGNITTRYRGYYRDFSAHVSGDYFFLGSPHWKAGWNVSAALHQITAANEYDPATARYSVNANYITLLSGPVGTCWIGRVAITLRPAAQFVAWQQKHLFQSFGACGTLSVSYSLSKSPEKPEVIYEMDH